MYQMIEHNVSNIMVYNVISYKDDPFVSSIFTIEETKIYGG